MAADFDDDEIISQVTQKLRDKHPDTDPATIEAAVRAELAELSGRPVRDYLMVLTERAAKKRLKG